MVNEGDVRNVVRSNEATLRPPPCMRRAAPIGPPHTYARSATTHAPRLLWQQGIRYQPGLDRSHYSTHCDIFSDVNGAVHAYIPDGRFIVPVYDV